MGTMAFGSDAMDEVAQRLDAAFQSQSQSQSHNRHQSVTSPTKQAEFGLGMGMAGAGRRRDMSARVRDVVLALALCHNVRETGLLKERGGVADVFLFWGVGRLRRC